MLSTVHITAVICSLLLVSLVGIYSVRRVKSSGDFAVGGRSAGTVLIAGTIVGTLAGGSATIGTAQLAFSYGFCAWWFTLGGGIACIILGLFLAKPLRDSGAFTGPAFLASVYGDQVRTMSSIFSSLGIFLSIIGQILAAVALLTSMFGINPLAAAFIAVILVVFYVVFGGVWGTGFVGMLKMILIYISMAAAGWMAYHMGGGIVGFQALFPPFPWFSLFGRGYSRDLASGFSLVVGVLSTQTYLQAVFSGKDAQASRRGAVLSGLIIIPVGITGTLVGLYMKAYSPHINPSEALPLFILQYLPHWLGGIVLATLLISVIGTGAGLVLGVSTMLSQDIYKKLIAPNASDQSVLLFSRISIVFISALTLSFVSGNLNSLILKWSILSMGLRGSTICLPLLFAVFFRGFVSPRAGRLAVALAPFLTILWAVFGRETVDPLYIGMLTSFLALVLGSIKAKRPSSFISSE